MNREQIIQMALEAGFEELFKDSHDWVCFTEEIERFHAIAVSAERKRLADKIEQDFKGAFGDDTCASWASWIRGQK